MLKPARRQPPPIDITTLATVTGGIEAFWIANPPMSTVGTGYGAWERSARERGLL